MTKNQLINRGADWYIDSHHLRLPDGRVYAQDYNTFHRCWLDRWSLDAELTEKL